MNFTLTTPVDNRPETGHMLSDTKRINHSIRGETNLNTRFITESEIQQRQSQICTDARRARNAFSISGVRQLFGNTLIALGEKLNGQCENHLHPAPRAASIPAPGV